MALLALLTAFFVFIGVRECSAFAKSRLAGGAKPNPDKSGQVVPLAGWLKITRLYNFSFNGARESLRLFVFKKCGWEKNKKHRVGNECRLTRCPFVIWSVCCPIVKMVYFFSVFSRLLVFVGASFTLVANGPRLCE